MNGPSPLVWLVIGRPTLRHAPSLAERLAAGGLRVGILDLFANDAIGGLAGRALHLGWSPSWAIPHLARRVATDRPALLHALDRAAAAATLALAEAWDIPYLQGVEQFLPNGDHLRLGRRHCRSVVVASHDLAEDLHGQMHVPRGMLSLIPPGVAADGEVPTGRLLPGRLPVIAYCGGLGANSGYPHFLEAARRVLAAGRDVEFIARSGEPNAGGPRDHAAHLGINDHLTLARQDAAAPTFWSMADLVCAPSSAADTGEELGPALAAGCTAIVADVPGLREWIVPARTGQLVPPGDIEALTAAILGLLDAPALANRLGRAAADDVRSRFDPGREGVGLAALYREALTPTKPPAERPPTPPSFVTRGVRAYS